MISASPPRRDGQQIGVGAGYRVEELTEDQDCLAYSQFEGRFFLLFPLSRHIDPADLPVCFRLDIRLG